MIFKTLASSSKGNAYTLFDGKTRLLIECGLTPKKLRESAGYPLTKFDACLISHEHGDHSRSAGYLAGLGIPLYMTQGTKDALGIPEARTVSAGKKQRIGTYIVLPFPAVHDAKEPVGFLIKSAEDGESLLFITDSAYMESRFSGMTEAAIETNYTEESLALSALPDGIKMRIRRSHMSLERALRFLSRCGKEKLRHIHLIHLSDAHSTEELFIKKVEEATGIRTTIG